MPSFYDDFPFGRGWVRWTAPTTSTWCDVGSLNLALVVGVRRVVRRKHSCCVAMLAWLVSAVALPVPPGTEDGHDRWRQITLV
jgi:hypothetical protein